MKEDFFLHLAVTNIQGTTMDTANKKCWVSASIYNCNTSSQSSELKKRSITKTDYLKFNKTFTEILFSHLCIRALKLDIRILGIYKIIYPYDTSTYLIIYEYLIIDNIFTTDTLLYENTRWQGNLLSSENQKILLISDRFSFQSLSSVRINNIDY